MEVSALKYHGGIGLHARSPMLRLQSDERLVALVRRGNAGAFETLVGRYEARLLAFCRHMLTSREDAEDVLQEVLAAAYNAMLADERPINVKPWLYRIARNRSLNHLRRAQAIGVDSMDIHFSEHGATTADKAHEREEFRLLVGDIHELPETQKTALVLREMDALSYEQIAEAMETTVPSVKSLLVRARVSLAEAAEARLLSCAEVRIELGEIAEGLRKRPTPLVRRHLKACPRCEAFQGQLKQTNRALAALLPLGPLVLLKKFVFAKTAGSAAGSHAGAAGGAAAGGLIAGGGAGSFVSAGVGVIATKAAAGLAAAALLTGAAVEVDHATTTRHPRHPAATAVVPSTVAAAAPQVSGASVQPVSHAAPSPTPAHHHQARQPPASTVSSTTSTTTASTLTTSASSSLTQTTTAATTPRAPAVLPGRTQTQTDPTVLSPTTSTITPPSPTTAPPPSTSTPPEPTNTSTQTSTGSSTTSAPPADVSAGPGPPTP